MNGQRLSAIRYAFSSAVSVMGPGAYAPCSFGAMVNTTTRHNYIFDITSLSARSIPSNRFVVKFELNDKGTSTDEMSMGVPLIHISWSINHWRISA